MKINYKWIGWCSEDNHDKVWGVIDLGQARAPDWTGIGGLDHKFVTFWGRRGKRLQTKISEQMQYDIQRLIDAKEKKGYTRVDHQRLDAVYPEFESDLQKTAVWAILCK